MVLVVIPVIGYRFRFEIVIFLRQMRGFGMADSDTDA